MRIVKPRSNKRRVLPFLLAVTLLVIGGGLLWLFQGGRFALAMAKHNLHAAGLPATIADVRPPRLRDQDNAAQIIARLEPLLSELNRPHSEQGTWERFDLVTCVTWDRNLRRIVRDNPFTRPSLFPLYLEPPLPPGGEAAIKTGMLERLDFAASHSVLALIREAASKTGYDASLVYKREDVRSWMKDGSSLLVSAALLSEHAMLAADHGQVTDACSDVWAMFCLADFASYEPSTPRLAIRHQILHASVESVEELAAKGSLPAEWNRKIASRIAEIRLDNDLARAVAGTGAIGGELNFGGILDGKIIFYTICPASSWGFPENITDQIWYGFHGPVRSEYADYLKWHRLVSTAVAQPNISLATLDERLREAAKLATPNRTIFKKLVPLAAGGLYARGEKWKNSVLVGVDGTFERLFASTWSLRSKIAATQVGLALELYRENTGGYPDTLEQLVPKLMAAVPVDPISGTPIRYERTTNGALVYGAALTGSDPLGLSDCGGTSGRTTWLVQHAR